MNIQTFFDPKTSSFTYVVSDPLAKAAVVIDPVLDYDPKGARTSTTSAESVAEYLDQQELSLHYVLDTHLHADHITAAPFFKERYGAKSVMGSGVVQLQETWKEIFGFEDRDEFPTDGSPFDRLLEDGDVLEVGALQIEAILTEGHTPASMTYKIGDALFVGDLIFMPDQGTARCDFPGGSAGMMYDSIQKLLALPEETRVFTLHDYRPGGRELRNESTIRDQKASNVHLAGLSRDEFIAKRKDLENGKEKPTLLYPAVQLNLRGGHLPPARENSTAYLKIPLNIL